MALRSSQDMAFPQNPHLIENRSAFHFWLRLRRAVLNLSGQTTLGKYPARGRYFLRLWGIRFFYWRISAASEATRSAIARQDVRPGDSIPIN
jgi:hypothetical protein